MILTQVRTIQNGFETIEFNIVEKQNLFLIQRVCILLNHNRFIWGEWGRGINIGNRSKSQTLCGG